MVRPASAILWNLPSLSMMYTSDCFTTLIVLKAMMRIITNNTSKTHIFFSS